MTIVNNSNYEYGKYPINSITYDNFMEDVGCLDVQ